MLVVDIVEEDVEEHQEGECKVVGTKVAEEEALQIGIKTKSLSGEEEEDVNNCMKEKKLLWCKRMTFEINKIDWNKNNNFGTIKHFN